MDNKTSKIHHFLAVFMLACVLLSCPLMSIFSKKTLFMGIPLLYFYIFSSWLAIIFLIYLASRKRTHRKIVKKSNRPPVVAAE